MHDEKVNPIIIIFDRCGKILNDNYMGKVSKISLSYVEHPWWHFDSPAYNNLATVYHDVYIEEVNTRYICAGSYHGFTSSAFDWDYHSDYNMFD